jgi:hypothetical protein
MSLGRHKNIAEGEVTSEAAAQVFSQLRAADRALHTAYCLLGEVDDAEQYQVYRLRLARLLSDTFIGVTRPLYGNYPELMPDEVKEILVLPPEAQQALLDRKTRS